MRVVPLLLADDPCRGAADNDNRDDNDCGQDHSGRAQGHDPPPRDASHPTEAIGARSVRERSVRERERTAGDNPLLAAAHDNPLFAAAHDDSFDASADHDSLDASADHHALHPAPNDDPLLAATEDHPVERVHPTRRRGWRRRLG